MWTLTQSEIIEIKILIQAEEQHAQRSFLAIK